MIPNSPGPGRGFAVATHPIPRRMIFCATQDSPATPFPPEPAGAPAPSARPAAMPGAVLMALEALAQQELAQLRRQLEQEPEDPPIAPLAALLAWDLGLTETR